MAKAYKCDLCGKFYANGRTMQIALGMDYQYLNEKTLKYDICSDCFDSFNLWKASRNPNHKSVFEDKEDQ